MARAERERLFAVHVVAARFLRAQLAREDTGGPARFLARHGVPVDGPWVVGYAPDRPNALINELRRHRFTDVEIRASGLVRTSHYGQLVDRFRDRATIGVRDHHADGAPVVAFAGYAGPHAGPDVPPVLHSPATAIHRPGDVLDG